MEPLRQDEVLLWQVRRKVDGANVHKVNNILGGYIGHIDLANDALKKGKTERYEREKKEVEELARQLQIFSTFGTFKPCS